MWTGKPEILAPAGSYEIMQQAFQAGADAVYLGGQLFGARAFAANLTEEELLRGIEYAQLHHKKLYLTVNTLLKNEEIDRLFAYLKAPYEAGLDAVIVQDLGVAALIHQQFPLMELHASTQMSLTSPYGANLLKELGAVRIVPARELSLEEIRILKQQTGLEIEVFVHGALCYSYSGHCLLSSMIGGRSGNRGRCAQPCRQLYSLPDGRKAYYLSPKDLCGLSIVPELIDAGVDSFKIEGRMKKPEYVIAAVDAYRRAVDACLEETVFDVKAEQEQLADIFNRGDFTEGYFNQHNGKSMMAIDRNHHNGIRIGTIAGIKGGQLRIQLQRELHHGDVLEIRTKRGIEIELTSGQTGNVGTEVVLNGKQIRDIQIGDAVYRTKNHDLCESLLTANAEKELKENIHISVTLKKDQSAMIKVDCGSHSITVTGTEVTKAQKQPLDRQVILDKLYKLGDAPFVITDVAVDMDDDCFFSMKEFNQLRRQAIAELELACRSNIRRKVEEIPLDSVAEMLKLQYSANELYERAEKASNDTISAPKLSVGVSNVEQLETVLKYPNVHRIELELECFSAEEAAKGLEAIHNQGKLGYFNLPRIYRMEMETELLRYMALQPDGYVARTIDEFALLRRQALDASVVCDYSIYAYNRIAVEQYQALIPDLHITLPVELNRKELQELISTSSTANWEWILYGTQPVMVTAQCTARNTAGCKKESGDEWLKNDYQDTFRIHRICKNCYNVIYQKQPTCLIPFRQELESETIRMYRVLLTNENAHEVKTILNFSSEKSGYYGHFMKGIE